MNRKMFNSFPFAITFWNATFYNMFLVQIVKERNKFIFVSMFLFCHFHFARSWQLKTLIKAWSIFQTWTPDFFKNVLDKVCNRKEFFIKVNSKSFFTCILCIHTNSTSFIFCLDKTIQFENSTRIQF